MRGLNNKFSHCSNKIEDLIPTSNSQSTDKLPEEHRTSLTLLIEAARYLQYLNIILKDRRQIEIIIPGNFLHTDVEGMHGPADKIT